MNDRVNKFSLAGHKFTPEMHLRQPGFTYSASETFTKNKERIQKIKETGDTKYICRNELDKARFQHDMAYEDFKDFAKRTASDKVLRDRAFNIAKILKHDGYHRGLASMVYKYFDKKTSDSRIKQNECPLDLAMQQLAEDLRKDRKDRKYRKIEKIYAGYISTMSQGFKRGSK